MDKVKKALESYREYKSEGISQGSARFENESKSSSRGEPAIFRIQEVPMESERLSGRASRNSEFNN
jgi:hypothetical protein